MPNRKPVNQTYIAISFCCIFLFTFILYLAYVMLPTYQIQLGFDPSYTLSETQQSIANDGAMLWITNLPRWAGTIIIIIVGIIILKSISYFLNNLNGNKHKDYPNIRDFILFIVGIAIVISGALITMGQLKQEAGVNSFEMVTSNAIISQLGTVPNWIGIMITVALAFIILGYFYNRCAY